MKAPALAGIVLAALVGVAAVGDLVQGLRRFDRMGPLGPGKPVPQFAVERLEGGRFDTAALAGRVHVVTFWATWCPYCRDELAELDQMAGRWSPDDVAMVAVNREGGGLTREQVVAVAQQYQRATGLRVPIAIDDGQMARAFGVGPIPHTAIFDREGQLRHVHQGRVRGETIADEIDALLR